MSNGVPTKVKLRLRGILLNNYDCDLCGDQEESISYLFFTCKVANMVWNLCNRWVGVLSVQHNQEENFQQFHLIEFNYKGNIIWKGVWMAIMLSIWKHRNNLVFRNAKSDAEEIFSIAQLRAWVWLKHKNTKVSFSSSDWCLCPLHCIRSLS